MLELSGLFVWLEGLSFPVHGGQKKFLGCGLLGGISTQADTMDTYKQEILIFYWPVLWNIKRDNFDEGLTI